jgi:myo-inositol-1(or 4)-monophosphatase
MPDEFLQFANEIAHSAGEILRNGFAQPHQMNLKTAQTDIVTETDRHAEDAIVSRIRATYPDHRILGEEGGTYAPEDSSGDGYQWVIDPLDGTTNFANGIPHFSVSIALRAPDGEPIVGVVYDPMRDEQFAAAKGQGATLNGYPLQVTTTDTLAQAVVASGFPYDKWQGIDNNVTDWGHFVERTRGIRRMGSAALDLAYVGAGRFDGYWEQKLHLWDMMAGVLIVEEAGGKVTGYDAQRASMFVEMPKIIASNGHIHTAMYDVLRLGDAAPRPATD